MKNTTNILLQVLILIACCVLSNVLTVLILTPKINEAKEFITYQHGNLKFDIEDLKSEMVTKEEFKKKVFEIKIGIQYSTLPDVIKNNVLMNLRRLGLRDDADAVAKEYNEFIGDYVDAYNKGTQFYRW